MDGKTSADILCALNDESLNAVSGGVGRNRPKYVSSFFCEQCGKTIRLNSVYTLERAKKLHDEGAQNQKSITDTRREPNGSRLRVPP